MTKRCRWWLALLGTTVLLGLLAGHPVLTAGSRPVPGRTAQLASPAPEPPTAEPPPSVPATENGPVDPPAPTVSISVRVPAQTAPGQDLVYQIRVVNRSRAAAHHVTVRDPLPRNAEYVRATPEPTQREPELVWRLGTMEGCATKEITLVLRPTGTGDIQNCARVQFEHGQCVTTRVIQPKASLTVRKTGPSQALLFDPIHYSVEVANTGNAPMTEVVLSDVLPRDLEYTGGKPTPQSRTLLTWNLGTLAAGQRRTIEYQVISKKPGTYTNLAVVTAAGGLRQESSSRVTVMKPEITLNMVGPERRYANLPATYELTVTNPGTAAASNLILTDTLPAQTRVLNVSDGGQVNEGKVEWRLGQLPAGTRRTVRLMLAVQGGGEIVNKATVQGDRGLTASAEVKTLFQGVAGLSGRITDTDPVEVGREFSYLFVVRNTGTAPATDVRVTAIVPQQLQIVEPRGPSAAKVEGERITFAPLPLKEGGELRFEIKVKALKAGDVRFRVELDAKELTTGPVREEESTTIFEEQPPASPPQVRLKPPIP